MNNSNSHEQLTQNVADRKAAETILELAAEMPEAAHDRFWEVLLVTIAKRLNVTVAREVPLQPDGPMTYDEAMAFERTVVPMGKYAGERVGDVPHSYWTYITESDFNRQLVRYIRSDHFQKRQDRE